MSKRSSDWHITGWKAFALLPLAIPVALLLKIFNVGQSKERSPEEVAGFIRDFIEDGGGEWDWDDFTSVTIKSPELDSIRDEACMIDLPLNEAGMGKLKELLAKAEALARNSSLNEA
jgi:hypothetical protein